MKIKIRSYWKSVNKMHYADEPQFCYSKDNHVGAFFRYPDGVFMGESIEMLYTGLDDKNNKEIFEGDIVRHRFKRCWQTEFHISKVVWDQKWCCFYLDNGTSNIRMRDDIEYEILGNIYQNSELLNK